MAVGGDRIADPSLISTIRGEVENCASASSPTRSVDRRSLRGDHGGVRQSRHGSQPSPISTIEGEVASYTSESSSTISVARRCLGGDRGGGRRSHCGSQPSPISTIGGVVCADLQFSGVWEEIATVGGDHIADLNRHQSPPLVVWSRAVPA
ncbi:hypothetical protein TIFTF001_050714 [Ficus carica]|uniref:Uncharacterized protein n=1 Tax=Ficus carica TaxID=3494 RepID=A0AA88D9L2_FICCA|nr:hypothetical protein TIFTF001_050714 [Ficus carica]